MSLDIGEINTLAQQNERFQPPISMRKKFPRAAIKYSFFKYAAEIVKNRDIPAIEDRQDAAQYLLHYDRRLRQVFNAQLFPRNKEKQREAKEAYEILQNTSLHNKMIHLIGLILKNTPPRILLTQQVNDILKGTKVSSLPKAEERLSNHAKPPSYHSKANP